MNVDIPGFYVKWHKDMSAVSRLKTSMTSKKAMYSRRLLWSRLNVDMTAFRIYERRGVRNILFVKLS